MIFSRRANPGFRVNRATQMIVQITAFRHAEQEVTKLERICRAAWRSSSARCSGLFCAAGAVEGFSCDKVEEAISNMRTRRRDELRCGRMRKGF